MPELHSLYFSASASARWMRCPPSVALSLGVKEDWKPAAAEGTMGHYFTERTLRRRLAALLRGKSATMYEVRNYLGQEHDGVRLAQHHLDDLQGYVNFIWSLVKRGGRVYIEQRVDYSQPLGMGHLTGVERAFGTADALVFMPDGTLWVIDLKFGKWSVDAENNSQMMFYGLGGSRRLRLMHDIQRFNLVIYQPRTAGRPDDQWRCSWTHLEKHTALARAAAARVMECVNIVKSHKGRSFPPIPVRMYAPSDDNCRFCKAEKCPARRATWSR